MTFDRIILIDKPAGMTSFGVVARVRRQLSEKAGKKIKLGHTGTLDPFATGLLVLLSGKMTKKSDEFLKLDKEYIATIVLGQTSTTGDPEGEIKPSTNCFEPPVKSQIEKTLKTFEGEIIQTPPIYSAIKINGRRAYDLARKGENPEMPKRRVKIYQIELLSYVYPKLELRVKCSSGTYIRSLAEDIGKSLNCGAFTNELRRTKIGEYDVANADESFTIE